MRKEVKRRATVRGRLVPPGDKSISHRAAILNSLATGKARIGNFSPGMDCRSTLSCLKSIGVGIIQPDQATSTIEIEGVGVRGFSEPEDILNAGNSATTIRLMTGLLAAQSSLSIITGDSSLRSRPMGRLILPLRLMGAKIWGRGRDTMAPLAIKGQELHGIEYGLPVASAQIKSAILIAALFTQSGRATIQEPSPSRDHTERLLRAMGVKVTTDGPFINLIAPTAPPKAIDIQVPGDISSAAYWLVLSAAHPDASIRISNVGVNPTRTGIIDALRAMGAQIDTENLHDAGGEPVADLAIRSSELSGTTLSGDLIPRIIDEIPILAVAASLARGTTTIRDATELRVKETDRITLLAKEMSRLGADIEELPDGMIVRGVARLRGATCSSHGDHRLAMALAVAGCLAEGETIIEEAEVAEVSYPGFWQDLETVNID
jgi:3-phosphoshikimate 1-carboxyvinyltransferase